MIRDGNLESGTKVLNLSSAWLLKRDAGEMAQDERGRPVSPR